MTRLKYAATDWVMWASIFLFLYIVKTCAVDNVLRTLSFLHIAQNSWRPTSTTTSVWT